MEGATYNQVGQIKQRAGMSFIINPSKHKYLTIEERLKLIKEIHNGKYLVRNKKGKIVQKKDKHLFRNHCEIKEVADKLGEVIELGAGSYGKAYQVCMPKKDCDEAILDDEAIVYSVKEVIFNDIGTYNTVLENPDRYENAEVRMLEFLSPFVFSNATPHVNLPIMTFVCVPEPDLPSVKIQDVDVPTSPTRYIISEIADYGNMHGFIATHFKRWGNRPDVYRVLFFQILSTLATIHKYYPNFMHNDFKPDNLLVRSTDGKGHFEYIVDDIHYYVPDVGFQVLLWDFDFSSIAGIVDNDKVIAMINHEDANITMHRNQYYDIHMCFGNIRRFWGHSFPTEVTDWLDDYVLNHDIPTAHDERILEGVEVTTPTKLLATDFFQVLRKNEFKDKPKDVFKGKLGSRIHFEFDNDFNRYTEPKTCEYQNFVFFDPKKMTKKEKHTMRNRLKCIIASESKNKVSKVSDKQSNKMNNWLSNVYSKMPKKTFTGKERKEIIKRSMELFDQFLDLYYVTSEKLYGILVACSMYASYEVLLSYVEPINSFRWWYKQNRVDDLNIGDLEDIYKQVCGFVAQHIEPDNKN